MPHPRSSKPSRDSVSAVELERAEKRLLRALERIAPYVRSPVTQQEEPPLRWTSDRSVETTEIIQSDQ